MVLEKTMVERAFELAQCGAFATIAELRKKLKNDGFIGHEIESHMASARLRVQLLHLCRQARTPPDMVAD